MQAIISYLIPVPMNWTRTNLTPSPPLHTNPLKSEYSAQLDVLMKQKIVKTYVSIHISRVRAVCLGSVYRSYLDYL